MQAAEVALKANGHIVILPGEGEFYEEEDEVTNPFISLDDLKEDREEAMLDGLTLFALALVVVGMMTMVACNYP